MSELIVNTDSQTTIRWKLLTGASALALASYLSSANLARAGDGNRPVVWLEAETQFALQSVDRESFLPPFLYESQFDGAFPTLLKKVPSEWDEGGKISLQPPGSDWVMSLGVRYGKSNRRRVAYQQTAHLHYGYYYTAYQDSKGSSSEKHLILDFQAGKDIGLGIFSHDTNAVVSVGVRFAQFDSRGKGSIQSVTAGIPSSYYIFHGSFEATRKFHGVGPSLSWDASTSLVGDPADGDLTVDWGATGALLFGRQRTNGHHEKTKLFQSGNLYGGPKMTIYQTSLSPSRSKNVMVPNLGGFAALSLRYTNVKVSLGYRADFFFGAIDGGIDARKTYDRNFHGPYASISIGLGG